MKTRVQILTWQEPDANTMDCKLNAEIVIFKTWNDQYFIGYCDMLNNNFHTNPDIENHEKGEVYYFFNDVKEFAIIK